MARQIELGVQSLEEVEQAMDTHNNNPEKVIELFVDTAALQKRGGELGHPTRDDVKMVLVQCWHLKHRRLEAAAAVLKSLTSLIADETAMLNMGMEGGATPPPRRREPAPRAAAVPRPATVLPSPRARGPASTPEPIPIHRRTARRRWAVGPCPAPPLNPPTLTRGARRQPSYPRLPAAARLPPITPPPFSRAASQRRRRRTSSSWRSRLCATTATARRGWPS